jgi:hypothetical protein
MRSSAHFSTGLIIWFLINSIQNSISIENTFFLMTSTIFLDIDIIGSRLFSEKNHRRYFTHSPIFWGIILVIGFLLSFDNIFWFGFGCFLHILLDILDWGIPYLPTKNSSLLPHILQVENNSISERDFSEIYWSNHTILRLEQLFFFVSLLIIFVLFIFNTYISFMFLLVSFFLLTSIISILDFVNSKRVTI